MDESKNHVEEEGDLYFNEFGDLEGDEIFSKFMSQSPVDFSELEQYTDDEMSQILAQGMDDSVVVHAPRTSPMPSTTELSTDFKKPQKKQSKSAPEESSILNPRRSKRIMLRRASATKSENMRRVEEYLLEHKAKSQRVQERARAAELTTLEMDTQDLSDANINRKEFRETLMNQIHMGARNEEIKLGIQWLMAPNPTMGRELSMEAFLGFAGVSSSAAGGDDALPRCIADDNHSLNDSTGKNGLAEASGKPADLAPTD
ncbi:hypothetical protein ACJRO7_030060 [Eucalyptus globulus]|uniref:Uncharacterized protein n=1 Tax=Eucalyptus globulus TaxID=34317 RepID=A0ABD3JCS1_EUCGL